MCRRRYGHHHLQGVGNVGQVYLCRYGVDRKQELRFDSAPGGTSDEAYTAIVSKLDEVGLRGVPFVGFSSDGATVMVGATNGVAAKLKAVFPALIATHCAAHRLNLAASDVSTSVSENVEDLASRLCAFFNRSSSRLSKLAQTAENLGTKFVKLARPTGKRWLSVGEALHTIVRMYPVLVAYLRTEQQHGEAAPHYHEQALRRILGFLHDRCDTHFEQLILVASGEQHFNL